MQFEDVLGEMNTIQQAKNHDYGDSVAKSFSEFGPIALVVRMSDKMERLKTLCKSEAHVAESMAETAIDLANYSAMLYMNLKNNDNGND